MQILLAIVVDIVKLEKANMRSILNQQEKEFIEDELAKDIATHNPSFA
jgi:hypothetical protein